MSKNPFIPDIDPRFFDHQMCEGCHIRRAAHIHHVEFKKMGGRHGAAKTKSEDAANKMRLCLVCHDATHLRRTTDGDGFWCGVCPLVSTCYYGARAAHLPYQHLTPRWGTIS